MEKEATFRRESVEALKKLAVDAHYWNSFNPERAAETILDCIESELCQYQSQIPEELHKDFESQYIDLTKQWLYALSRCASAAVTGPAKFNVRKAEKANNAEHAARGRIYDFAARFIKRANRQQRLTGWEEIERLQIKVDQLTQLQELMKATNVIIRNKKLSDEEKIDEIVMLGISESNAKKLLEPDFCGRIGFASYQLTNNLAKIKQAQGRIDNLTKMVNTENREVEFDWGTIELDYQDERIRLHFNDIPPVELRKKLKENAFKWSRMNQAWQRQLTPNALRATKHIFGLTDL